MAGACSEFVFSPSAFSFLLLKFILSLFIFHYLILPSCLNFLHKYLRSASHALGTVFYICYLPFMPILTERSLPSLYRGGVWACNLCPLPGIFILYLLSSSLSGTHWEDSLAVLGRGRGMHLNTKRHASALRGPQAGGSHCHCSAQLPSSVALHQKYT